jgi:selenocysteine-specific elongation factor
MLAGAHGIDAVLLVVAADESVMPQTVEHFHICRLLGVTQGLVALTKCDIADPELQAAAELEVRELLEGSFLAGTDVVRVSARTGEGLDALREALARLGRAAAARPEGGLLRLPVDRVFTLRGFGTVVTGTLVQGALAIGDELELLPAGRRTRVRGLQVHGAVADRVPAGRRAALNLAGLEVSEVSRGDVLTRPGTLLATSMLDCVLELLPGTRPLQDQARLRVHLASAERIARVRLLEAPVLPPGGRGLAQLRLEQPGVAGLGDRLVLRSYSPAATIGGARVLDPLPHRRRRGDRIGRLTATDPDDATGTARALVEAEGARGHAAARLAARVTRPVAELRAALDGPGLVWLPGDPGWWIAEPALEALGARALAALEEYHARHPLRRGMPREELRHRIFAHAPPGAFECVIEARRGSGEIQASAESLARTGHAVTLSPEEQRSRAALEQAAREAGLAGVVVATLAGSLKQPPALLERVAAVLQHEERLRRVGDTSLVHEDHLVRLEQDVRHRWPPGSRLDVAGFKELTGLTRKHVIPLLEHLDARRVTRRQGGDRYVR